MKTESSLRALGLAVALASTLGLAAGCGAAPGGIDDPSAAVPEGTATAQEGLTASCGVAITGNRADNNYCGFVTVKNTGTSSLNQWTVDFDVPSGVTVDYVDAGIGHTQVGTHLHLVPDAAHATLAAAASLEIAYCNSGSASLLAQSPVAKTNACPIAQPAATTTTITTATTTAAPAPAPTPTASGAAPVIKAALGQHVMTWYSFQDNTPVNSALSASGRKLIPYISVALPFRFLKAFGGTIGYGDQLYLAYLAGRTMPNGSKHTGWVQVDDFCGDSGDDSYCFQLVGGTKYPNVNLYVGDFTKSGMSPTACSGPAGSGQELTALSTGVAGSAWVPSYGGAALGSGKCGDYTSARAQHGSCWDYTPPTSSVSQCAGCTGTSCSSW